MPEGPLAQGGGLHPTKRPRSMAAPRPHSNGLAPRLGHQQRGPPTAIGPPLRCGEHGGPQSLPGLPGAAIICACRRWTSCWGSSRPRSAR